MRLSAFQLTQPTQQDRLDLSRLYPEVNLNELLASPMLFVARFNDRLLAGVTVEIEGKRAVLSQLQVREVTRRRGIGRFLLTQLPGLLEDQDIEGLYHPLSQDQGCQQFLAAMGFEQQDNGWFKPLD